MYFLNEERFNRLAQKYHAEYSQGKPFPHVVIDDFLPEEILDEVANEFPAPGQVDWQEFYNAEEKKLALRDETQMGHKTRLLLYQLNASVFINFLEILTGIDGLIPDPYFGGGSLHQIVAIFQIS